MASLDRRRTLTGAAALALGVPVLAACGTDSGDSATSPDPTTAGPPGEALAATDEVPVGGCFVASAAPVVVTQPTKGEFRAFTSVCTHQGCTVSSGSDGVIPCGCHGSQFALTDGSVVQGPATSPLAEVDIAVDGDAITLA